MKNTFGFSGFPLWIDYSYLSFVLWSFLIFNTNYKCFVEMLSNTEI